MPGEEASAEYNRTAYLISRAWRSPEFRLFCAFCLLSAAFSILYPATFPTAANVANMSRVAGVLFVVTAGQMCALLVGGFDLSVASNIGFVGVVTALGMTRYGGLPSGLMMGLVTGALIGLVNGGLIAWARLSPFIVTLGMLSFLLGFGNEIAHGAPIFGFPNGFEYLAVRDWGPVPAPVAISGIVLILLWMLLARSKIGLYMYAIGAGREACRAAGVPVARYEVIAYTICGILAGLAGVMELSRVSVGYVTNGQSYLLPSIAAAVIGGTAIGGGAGTLRGVVLGVAVLTVLSTGMDIAGLNEFYQRMVTGSVIVLSVLVSRRSNWPTLFSRPSAVPNPRAASEAGS
jgi:ribose/xylose/arabinose/galactoside ABC-type transport system permease subunit